MSTDSMLSSLPCAFAASSMPPSVPGPTMLTCTALPVKKEVNTKHFEESEPGPMCELHYFVEYGQFQEVHLSYTTEASKQSCGKKKARGKELKLKGEKASPVKNR